MNLRELLLQFAGENNESLKLEDLITKNIEDVDIIKGFSNGVELYCEKDVNETIKDIDILLIENNYDFFEISKDKDIVRIELM
jgi:hypothetical protein